MDLSKIIDKTKDQSNKLGEQLKSVRSIKIITGAELLESLKSFGISNAEKVRASIKEISSASPIIKRAGFEIFEVNTRLSIPPRAEVKFEYNDNISEEELNKLLEETKDSKLITTLLQILFKASSAQSMVEGSGLKLKTVSIMLSIPPRIDVSFKKDGSEVLTTKELMPEE